MASAPPEDTGSPPTACRQLTVRVKGVATRLRPAAPPGRSWATGRAVTVRWRYLIVGGERGLRSQVRLPPLDGSLAGQPIRLVADGERQEDAESVSKHFLGVNHAGHV